MTKLSAAFCAAFLLLATLCHGQGVVNGAGGGACPTTNGNANTFCNGTGSFSTPPVGATVPGYTVNGLQSGGGVFWTTGYSFRVSAANYTIAGSSYSSAETTVTLSAADPSLDRIDVIAVNSSGVVVVVAGTAASPAVKPEVDSSTQLELTFVTVSANTTQPVTVTTTDIYHENTEWTTSKTGTPINLASTNNPHAGTVDIEATSTVSGNLFQFTIPAAGTIDLGTRTNLVFYIRSKAAWTSGQGLNLAWYNGTTKKGSSVILTSGQFGFNSGTTSAYQQIVVPLSLFGINGIAVTSLKATVQGTGSFGFYVDDVTLQGGVGGVTYISTTQLPLWLQNNPDAYPLTPDPMDDEFDGGGLNAKWTAFDANADTVFTVTNGRAKAVSTTSTGALRGYYQALPAGNWKFTSKVMTEPPLTTGNSVFGLVLIESSTGKVQTYYIGTIGSTSKRLSDNFTASGATFSASGPATVLSQMWPMYMSIAYDGTNYTYSASITGVADFKEITVAKTSFFTTAADRIGIVASSSKTGAIEGYWEFFRRVQ